MQFAFGLNLAQISEMFSGTTDYSYFTTKHKQLYKAYVLKVKWTERKQVKQMNRRQSK